MARVHLVQLANVVYRARWLPTFGPSRSARASDPATLSDDIHHHIFIVTQAARQLTHILPYDGGRRLSKPRWLVTYQYSLRARRQSPIQVLTRPYVGL